MKGPMFRPSRREMLPIFLAGAISAKAEVTAPRRVILKASDGVTVYAWHYAAADKARPAILLFHQAGSNHAEYKTIAPRRPRSGITRWPSISAAEGHVGSAQSHRR